MKTFVAFFIVSFLVGTVFADSYSVILNRARSVSASDNSAPQNSRPQSPQPSPPPANPQPDPVLQATLQNISDLRADFDALGKLSEVKPDSPEKKSLLKDLKAAAAGAKPLSDSISKLSDHLAVAVAGKDDMEPQHAKLAQDIHAIFNSSHLSPEQQQMIFDGARSILKNGGAEPDSVTNVVNDIKTIAAETQ